MSKSSQVIYPLVAVVVTVVVTVVVVVGVVVTDVVGDDVGVVRSQSSNVPSMYDANASFKISILLSHCCSVPPIKNPPSSQRKVPFVSSRLYSKSISFKSFENSAHLVEVMAFR